MKSFNKDGGFTLLEVVVAVAILATALGVLYPTFAISPRRVQVAEQRSLATAHLQGQFDDILLRHAWNDLPLQGGFQDWTWTISGENYPHVSDADTDPDFLFKITATTSHEQSSFGGDITFERIVVRTD